MEFLLSHWHCILPAIAILVAVILMNRGKAKKADDSHAGDRDNGQEF